MTMRRFDILIFLLLLTFSATAASATAEEPPTLNGMESNSELGITRMVLDFNKLPTYSLKTSGQRIDLRLNDTTTGSGIKRLPEDDKVIKVLVARDKEGVVVSFLLRRLPGNVLVTPDAHLHQLNLSIRWEEDGRVRPGIVFDLPDMPAVRMTGSELKRTALTPSTYRGDWLSFLKKSHTPIRCELAPFFTFPPLPSPKGIDPQNFPDEKEWLDLAENGEWQKLEEASAEAVSALGLLLNMEARLRQRDDAQVLGDLQILKRSLNEDELLPRLRYLQAHAQVKQQKYFEALLNLTEIEVNLKAVSRWKEMALLFQAEIELALNHPKQALKALNKLSDIEGSEFALTGSLRRMDQLALSGEYEEALNGYQSLPVDLVDRHPFSLSQMAFSNQLVTNHSKARECFSLLAQHKLDEATRALARFGELTCYKDPQDILVFFDELQKLRWDTPKAEVAYRIVMKLTDMMAPAKNEAATRRQLANYQMVSEEAGSKALRQEAAIKVAVLQHLQGEDTAAIAQLEKTLRNFSGGHLRAEAIALLGEILPPTIRAMITEGRNIDALVLVERNRDLLIQQPLSWDFLFEVAQAFDRLDLDDRADKIFLYLYDRADTKERKAQACMLLAGNYLQLEEFSLAREYADRYRHFQPKGPDHDRAVELGLKARVALDGIESGLDWVKSVPFSNSPDLNLYIADLNWQLNRYEQVIERLTLLKADGVTLSAAAALKEAEAYYRIGKHDLALKHYRELFETEGLSDQARYRAGTILIDGRDQLAGQELLKSVTEGQTPSPWSRLAADSLRGLTL